MAATQTLSKREVIPPNYAHRALQQSGLQFKKPSAKEQFLDDFTVFQKNCAQFETEASKYLYDNPEAGEHEYGVHCHYLGALIADGQGLLVGANCANIAGIDAENQFIEQKVAQYIATLHDWHGASGSHPDESSYFQEGMRQTDFSKSKTGPL